MLKSEDIIISPIIKIYCSSCHRCKAIDHFIQSAYKKINISTCDTCRTARIRLRNRPRY